MKRKTILLSILLTSILAVAIFFVNSCTEHKFKYYRLDNLSQVDKVLYNDKKVYNDLIVKFKDNKGCITISCLAITYDDYKKYFSNTFYSQFKSRPQEIIVKFNNTNIKAKKIIINDDYCTIGLNTYNNGVATLISYFGSCDTKKYFDSFINNIKFYCSDERIINAQKNLYSIIELIKNINIPIYEGARGVNSDYTDMGLSKRLYFYTVFESNSVNIYNYYIHYFQNLGWKLYKRKDTNKANDDNLVHVMVDESEELMINIFVHPTANKKQRNKMRQNVYINIYPFKYDLGDYCEIKNN